MTKVDIAWFATGAASMLFTFGLAPALLYFRVRKKNPKERHWLLWLPMSVVLTWLFLLAFRLAVEVPVNLAKARQEGDSMADGVGGNVAVLIGGWIIPLFGCVLFALLFTMIDRRKRPPNQPPQRNAGSRPSSGDTSASETPSSLGPRG